MDFEAEKFARNVDYLCSKHNVTKGELENKIGVSKGYLSRKSDKIPGVDKIMRIAEFFSVTIDSLVKEELSKEDKSNVSLIHSFVEKLIADTNSGDIIWSVDFSYDGDFYEMDVGGVPEKHPMLDVSGAVSPDGEVVEWPLYRGRGQFAGILYKGTFKNGMCLMLAKESAAKYIEEGEQVSIKQGWGLYRVMPTREEFNPGLGEYVEVGPEVELIYSTIEELGVDMCERTNRLVDSIIQSLNDIPLDWEMKSFLLNFLNKR